MDVIVLMDNAMDSGHDDEGRESRPANIAEVWDKYNRSGIVTVTIYKSCEYVTKDWHLLRIDTLKKVKQEMRISVDTGWALFFLLANLL